MRTIPGLRNLVLAAAAAVVATAGAVVVHLQPEDTTRKLAERFGHTFSKTEDVYQVHGVVTHVIDREGRWQANFHGLKFDPTSLVLFVNALTKVNTPHGHRARSLWDKMRGLF